MDQFEISAKQQPISLICVRSIERTLAKIGFKWAPDLIRHSNVIPWSLAYKRSDQYDDSQGRQQKKKGY